MKNKQSYLSIDLGASSGRVIINTFSSKITQLEVHRFETKQIKDDNYMYWDFNFIFNEIKKGIKKSFEIDNNILSIGINTWGCDFGYINKFGKLMRNPISYRDKRNKVGKKLRNKIINERDLYDKTGIQHLDFNTINQIVYDYNYYKDFDDVDKILLIPDLIAYFLTNNKYIELTNLSTTQLYDPNKKEVIKEVDGINIKKLLPKIIYPGNIYGYLKEELVSELNIKKIPVVATNTHDTASAIFSLDLKENQAYLSSGTWSLLGVLNNNPIINENALNVNFSNEIGFDHKIRFLKNITGFYIKNKLFEEFDLALNSINFNKIDMSALNSSFDSYIDVDHNLFNVTKDIKNSFDNYFKLTNQKQATSIEDYIRSFTFSLVFKYKEHLKALEKITNNKITSLIVIGGGANSEFTNQLIANTLQIPVIVGEVEATSLGNALIQHMTINNLTEKEVKEKYKKQNPKTYYPKEKFEQEFEKYIKIINEGDVSD